MLLNRLMSRSEWVGDCLIYQGQRNGTGPRYGYGLIGVMTTDGKYRRLMAHRVMYELQVGPIPDGLVLDHVRARGCQSTACINVAHLEPVTRRTNTERGDAMNLRRACREGHLLTAENTYVYLGKTRVIRYCRTCRRANDRKRVSTVETKED